MKYKVKIWFTNGNSEEFSCNRISFDLSGKQIELYKETKEKEPDAIPHIKFVNIAGYQIDKQ